MFPSSGVKAEELRLKAISGLLSTLFSLHTNNLNMIQQIIDG